MGSHNYKKNKKSLMITTRRWLVSTFHDSKSKKKRSKKKTSSSKLRRGSQEEDGIMRMQLLASNDEAFHLSIMDISEIIDIICSQRTPTPKEYMKWNQYARSFYHKMVTCFSSFKEQDEEHMECTRPLTKETSLKEKEEHTDTEEMSYEERLEELANVRAGFCRQILWGPFKFGSYSAGNMPEDIPYHLYLLVKEAVDIMKRSDWHSNTNDLTALPLVEKKIRFFCKYFYCHLPLGWEYNREKASNIIADYDTNRKPIYNMPDYTPIPISRGFVEFFEYDVETRLSRHEMIDVMSIIHSRKTPTFWRMSPKMISFYCKLCSCFRIDYHQLEAASKDDVSLMYMGSVLPWY